MFLIKMKKMLVLVALVSLSLGATAQVQDGGTVAEIALPPLIVLSADVVSPVADLIAPLPKEPHTPDVGKGPPAISSSIDSVGGSSLTIKEAELVIGMGRHFDFKTKTWGWRYPMSGEKRENFLLSIGKKRITGVWAGLSYSK